MDASIAQQFDEMNEQGIGQLQNSRPWTSQGPCVPESTVLHTPGMNRKVNPWKQEGRPLTEIDQIHPGVGIEALEPLLTGIQLEQLRVFEVGHQRRLLAGAQEAEKICPGLGIEAINSLLAKIWNQMMMEANQRIPSNCANLDTQKINDGQVTGNCGSTQIGSSSAQVVSQKHRITPDEIGSSSAPAVSQKRRITPDEEIDQIHLEALVPLLIEIRLELFRGSDVRYQQRLIAGTQACWGVEAKNSLLAKTQLEWNEMMMEARQYIDLMAQTQACTQGKLKSSCPGNSVNLDTQKTNDGQVTGNYGSKLIGSSSAQAASKKLRTAPDEALPCRTWLTVPAESLGTRRSLALVDSTMGGVVKDASSVKKLFLKNPLIMFGRRGCCMCILVKRLLLELVKVYEVDEEDEVGVINELQRIGSGRGNDCKVQLPSMFIRGRLFGGLDELLSTHNSG
ncbi:hypothetical protein HHK36_003629 [Tetracentron sinense]|uniref:Uncharacterized protein n=1 Tax=Tetracentron sinense TaxID=13715 RepID=A0A834ZSV0_TETSI|nr:hypothetical protein HHK36_003629 [Tetracentron sinense]